MTHDVDLAVIGSGTAASVTATRIRDAGWSVALVDAKPYGGTCALRGCDPKKVLVSAAAAIDHVRRMGGRGIAGQARIDWPELVRFKRSFTDPVPRKKEEGFAEKGIVALHGHAKFTGPTTLDVEGTEVRARHVVIATGARPAPLGIPGEEHLVTNEEFLELDRLPKRIVLVGGGYIAAEFSNVAALAGSEVTILQRGKRLLKPFDADLVGWLMEKFEEHGIDVRTGASVEAVERHGEAFRVTASREGQSFTVEADLVVHASGRVPDLDGLDLERADIAVKDGRLELDEHLRSVSNPAVYAAGDAAQAGPPLTPVASHDAKVVVANLLNGPSRKPDYRGVPSVAFTIPPIAAVGMGEDEARDEGLKFRVSCQRAAEWFTARHTGESVYGFKVLVEEGSERILGAHLVGPHVDEVINVFALAIRHKLTAQDLSSTMFAYPTGASDLGSMLG